LRSAKIKIFHLAKKESQPVNMFLVLEKASGGGK